MRYTYIIYWKRKHPFSHHESREYMFSHSLGKQPPASRQPTGRRCCSTWRSTQKRHGASDEDAGFSRSPPDRKPCARWFKPWPFYPQTLEVTSNLWKRYLTIPKRSRELKGVCLVLYVFPNSESVFWVGFLGSKHTSWKGIWSTRVSWWCFFEFDHGIHHHFSPPFVPFRDYFCNFFQASKKQI